MNIEPTQHVDYDKTTSPDTIPTPPPPPEWSMIHRPNRQHRSLTVTIFALISILGLFAGLLIYMLGAHPTQVPSNQALYHTSTTQSNSQTSPTAATQSVAPTSTPTPIPPTPTPIPTAPLPQHHKQTRLPPPCINERV